MIILLGSADGAAEVLSAAHVGELVIDGGTLGHILGTEMEQELAAVGAQCGSVVICRSSPSQKAAVVRMMSEYEMRQVRLLPLMQGVLPRGLIAQEPFQQ